MIVTVTLNPSLDYIQFLSSFTEGGLNRCKKELIRAGGKGINVSLMLKALGVDNVAAGFAGGFTGDELLCALKSSGVQCRFVKVNGLTRINVKVMAEKETEINGNGPDISEDDLNNLIRELKSFQAEDFIVLSGSIASGLGQNVYAKIMKSLNENKTRFVVDSSGEALKAALAHQPFLIKPNNYELSELVKTDVDTPQKAAVASRKLQELGAQNVLCSLGGEGAVLVGVDGSAMFCKPPRGKLVNSVAAGDSMIAGFLAEYQNSGDFASALRMAVASGSATAYSEWLADKNKIYQLLNITPNIEYL